ncbi:TetR/AcrR family transcriptional regulator [Patulibacter sp. NPDC049589]|uniref:TetR/AcrR family transcriptional regulator n=1 Tax=Patulibacter sp. NPDC049589 TaxID=3154731 RepID=UPI003413828E
MIRSGAQLFRERGVSGTSFADVLEHSGAPRGSVYHHFPGGKDEFAIEVTRYAGGLIGGALRGALEGDDPVAAVRSFADMWIGVLESGEYAAGCPVVAVAVDAAPGPGTRAAAGDAFAAWESDLAVVLVRRGVGEDRARSLATLVLSGIEGAIVLCRAQGSAEPLRRVAGELATVVGAAVAGSRPPA